MTAPWPPEVAQLLAAPHSQGLTATAVPRDGAPFELTVEGYRVSMDEDRSPRVLVQLDCAALDSGEELERFDPRTGARVELSASYTLPSGAIETHQIADLGLRERVTERPANVMSLSCTSAESFYIEAGIDVPGGGSQTWDSPQALIRFYLEEVYPAYGPLGGYGVLLDTTTQGANPYDADTSPADFWAMLTDAAEAIDADLYDPGDRLIRLAPRRYLTAQSVLNLSTGPGGTLTDSSATVSRESWANEVHVMWEWEGDPATAWRSARAQVSAGPYATYVLPQAPLRVLPVERRGYISQVHADRIAGVLLRRALSRARTYTLTAVSAWWVRPGDTITVQLPTGDQERHLVSSVEHTTGGRMQLTTRLPDTESTIGE